MTSAIENIHSKKYKRLFVRKLFQLHEAEAKLEVLKKEYHMMKVKNDLIRAENLAIKSKQVQMEIQGRNEQHRLFQKVQILRKRSKRADDYLKQLEKLNKRLRKKNKQLKSQNQNSATSEEMESLRAEYRSFQRNVEREHHANIERPQIEINSVN